MNSVSISRNARLGGGSVGSPWFSGGLTAKRMPSRCKAVMASLFLTASKPKDKANLFASSCMGEAKAYRGASGDNMALKRHSLTIRTKIG